MNYLCLNLSTFLPHHKEETMNYEDTLAYYHQMLKGDEWSEDFSDSLGHFKKLKIVKFEISSFTVAPP